MTRIIIWCFILIGLNAFSQDKSKAIYTISPDLMNKANAVVRSFDINVNLQASNKMTVSVNRVVSVLNEYGDTHVDAYIHYDDNVKIKKLQATAFDALGKVVKKIKAKNFNDQSAVDGGTLYSDSRVKFLEYTPVSYPYSIEFSYVTINESTAFIPPFRPLNSYYLSVENASYKFQNPSNISIRKKESDFLEDIKLENIEIENGFGYAIKALKAIEHEDHSPLLSDIVPEIKFSANEFTIEGTKAKIENWNDFGKWMYNDLIIPTQDLPEATINAVKDLVKGVETDVEKAKIIYKYVQDRSRYISVQVGIGGWKPIGAAEVDKMGYGDCKGLTNYTMALLKAVGVNSKYAIVYSDSSQRNLERDFASMQGDHVILNIPQNNKESIWLELYQPRYAFWIYR